MRTWFRFGFMLLTISLLSIGCERSSFKEAREEEERFGNPNALPEQPTLEDELSE